MGVTTVQTESDITNLVGRIDRSMDLYSYTNVDGIILTANGEKTIAVRINDRNMAKLFLIAVGDKHPEMKVYHQSGTRDGGMYIHPDANEIINQRGLRGFNRELHSKFIACHTNGSPHGPLTFHKCSLDTLIKLVNAFISRDLQKAAKEEKRYKQPLRRLERHLPGPFRRSEYRRVASGDEESSSRT